MAKIPDISELTRLYLSGTLSKEQWEQLKAYLETAGDHPEFNDELLLAIKNEQYPGIFDEQELNAKYEQLTIHTVNDQASGKRGLVWLMRTSWIKYAAALIIITGAGAYIWFRQSTSQPAASNPAPVVMHTNIPPGRDGAVLTLADGSQVRLDSIQNGAIAPQGGALAKVTDGKLMYEAKSKEVVYNTMSTPKGRQYHFTLPDGSEVWLNAASSIRYPTVFTGNERNVEITGEVYFEVATLRLGSGQKMPFRVNVDSKAQVEVLGTHFNVNAYANESNINITLLEGAVQVSHENEKAELKPGQQARIGDHVTVNAPADPAGFTAWKNGMFDFNASSFLEVMRQLERWYDIEVSYEKGIPVKEIKGRMYRDVGLADVLDVFKKAGLDFRMEGKKLIITN